MSRAPSNPKSPSRASSVASAASSSKVSVKRSPSGSIASGRTSISKASLRSNSSASLASLGAVSSSSGSDSNASSSSGFVSKWGYGRAAFDKAARNRVHTGEPDVDKTGRPCGGKLPGLPRSWSRPGSVSSSSDAAISESDSDDDRCIRHVLHLHPNSRLSVSDTITKPGLFRDTGGSYGMPLPTQKWAVEAFKAAAKDLKEPVVIGTSHVHKKKRANVEARRPSTEGKELENISEEELYFSPEAAKLNKKGLNMTTKKFRTLEFPEVDDRDNDTIVSLDKHGKKIYKSYSDGGRIDFVNFKVSKPAREALLASPKVKAGTPKMLAYHYHKRDYRIKQGTHGFRNIGMSMSEARSDSSADE